MIKYTIWIVLKQTVRKKMPTHGQFTVKAIFGGWGAVVAGGIVSLIKAPCHEIFFPIAL
jgi:hypothetical protein